jgi:hypothetical protein
MSNRPEIIFIEFRVSKLVLVLNFSPIRACRNFRQFRQDLSKTVKTTCDMLQLPCRRCMSILASIRQTKKFQFQSSEIYFGQILSNFQPLITQSPIEMYLRFFRHSVADVIRLRFQLGLRIKICNFRKRPGLKVGCLG